IRRNINLLKYKLNYDISTRDENGKGYYMNRNPKTDFEPEELRAIIDNFSYANYIVPSMAKKIIKKCKNIENTYEVNKKTSKKTKNQKRNIIESTVEISDGKKEEIEAICESCLLDTVLEVFGKDITIQKVYTNNSEKFKLIVNTNPKGFKMWAMRNIDTVTVKRPAYLKKEMQDIIWLAGERYANN
ncbi:MAG: hypothetical protein HUJ68_09405, partial [Clostridia bacterium]|nr:hypothetical protein [Clostridia bacterium]